MVTWVIVWFEEPSKSWSRSGSTERVGSLYLLTNSESTKLWEDPESMRAIIMTGRRWQNSFRWRDRGSERADALSRRILGVPEESTQSSHGTEVGGLRTNFLSPRRRRQPPWLLHPESPRWP